HHQVEPNLQEVRRPPYDLAQAHLALALAPLGEADGDFADPRAGPACRPVEDLDQERVAGGVEAVPRNALEHAAAGAAETGGAVARGEWEEDPKERFGGRARQPGEERPCPHPAARRVARADHEVSLLERVLEPDEVSGVVGEVGVHGEDRLRSAAERLAKAVG